MEIWFRIRIRNHGLTFWDFKLISKMAKVQTKILKETWISARIVGTVRNRTR
jgi:hypothetical protein